MLLKLRNWRNDVFEVDTTTSIPDEDLDKVLVLVISGDERISIISKSGSIFEIDPWKEFRSVSYFDGYYFLTVPSQYDAFNQIQTTYDRLHMFRGEGILHKQKYVMSEVPTDEDKD